MPSREEVNAQGCPLRSQTGQDAVSDFDALIASWPEAMRAAFYAEQSARAQEINETVAEYGYNT